jgi:hypothetical protein
MDTISHWICKMREYRPQQKPPPVSIASLQIFRWKKLRIQLLPAGALQ